MFFGFCGSHSQSIENDSNGMVNLREIFKFGNGKRTKDSNKYFHFEINIRYQSYFISMNKAYSKHKVILSKISITIELDIEATFSHSWATFYDQKCKLFI